MSRIKAYIDKITQKEWALMVVLVIVLAQLVPCYEIVVLPFILVMGFVSKFLAERVLRKFGRLDSLPVSMGISVFLFAPFDERQLALALPRLVWVSIVMLLFGVLNCMANRWIGRLRKPLIVLGSCVSTVCCGIIADAIINLWR